MTTDRSRREVAAEFEVSYRQLGNHFTNGHVEEAVRASLAAQPRRDSVRAGSTILNSLEDYRSRIDRALERTDDILTKWGKSDPGVALAALREQMSQVREATRLLELSGKLTGELDQTKFSLYVLPQWTEIRDVILEALEAFPEARMAILGAMTAKLASRAAQALPAPATDDVVEVEADELPESA